MAHFFHPCSSRGKTTRKIEQASEDLDGAWQDAMALDFCVFFLLLAASSIRLARSRGLIRWRMRSRMAQRNGAADGRRSEGRADRPLRRPCCRVHGAQGGELRSLSATAALSLCVGRRGGERREGRGGSTMLATQLDIAVFAFAFAFACASASRLLLQPPSNEGPSHQCIFLSPLSQRERKHVE